jgi:predicted nucleotidyltransferase
VLLGDLPIRVDLDEIAGFCRDRGIRCLALFGSVRGKDFTPASDVDVLVEYLPGRHPGLMLFRRQDELAVRFERVVGLGTPASLSPQFRAELLAQALSVYEQA